MTTTPSRKQRRPTKGWRAPAGSTYVGRGSKWGNPYTIQQQGQHHTVIDPTTEGVIYSSTDATDARRVAVAWYRAWIDNQPQLLAEARQQLARRDLLCWCPLPNPGEPDHCHAAVLIYLVNQQDVHGERVSAVAGYGLDGSDQFAEPRQEGGA